MIYNVQFTFKVNILLPTSDDQSPEAQRFLDEAFDFFVDKLGTEPVGYAWAALDEGEDVSERL